jgi:hypothetical protein
MLINSVLLTDNYIIIRSCVYEEMRKVNAIIYYQKVMLAALKMADVNRCETSLSYVSIL